MIMFVKRNLLALLERRAIFTGPSPMDLEWAQDTCFGNLAIQAPLSRLNPAALNLAPVRRLRLLDFKAGPTTLSCASQFSATRPYISTRMP